MKKIEIILVGLLIIALAMKTYHMPSAGIILTATALTLSFMYALLGMHDFGKIDFKNILQQQRFEIQFNNRDKLLSFITGMGLSVGIIGLLFGVQHWPSSNIMLSASAITLALTSVYYGVNYSKKKDTKYFNIFKRTIALLGALLVLYFSKSVM